ncbi:DUF5330 domain-containing protein [Xanthobacter sp. V2C-8]|uniref:DUF5330 domain-containing protein n=1 Tax=Xanthobacter albus TaxID=3119929 RepID=UPI0037265063
MFFLLRMAFWISLVLLLLPLGLKGTSGQDVSVFDAFGAVQAVVADARGFCARQPEACAVGGQMATHLAEKAQAGAKWISDTLAARESTPAAEPAAAGTQALSPQSLTPQDLAPGWGGGEKVQPAAAPQGVPVPAKRPS